MVEVSGQSHREAGVLLHITSLPGGHGIGDLGEGARLFVDWLSNAGMKIWQVLPLVPVGPGNSPYSTTSAFASNPLLIDLCGLVADGLLSEADLGDWPNDYDGRDVDYDAVKRFKEPLLEKAARTLLEGDFPSLRAELDAFIAKENWVSDVALFHVLKEANDGCAWWTWEDGLRKREAEAITRVTEAFAEPIATYIAIQFFFERQWHALAGLCQERGITLVGDLPIYVAADSADVWTNPDGFLLDENYAPEAVAGVPPDAFSATGQLWGNPLYDWPRMASDGYAWWKARLGRVLSQTPRVRIDHFRAFSAYWSIPADAVDARSGQWIEGPGMAFFESLFETFGRDVPIIAEDLGMVDDAVYQLVDDTGFPGMKVLQFAFDGDDDNLHLPHRHPQRSVVYTGTHDNDTILGWWFSCGDAAQDQVRRYLSSACYDAVQDLVATAYRSAANTAIIPMQDVLALDSAARMNTPSVGQGNWAWRMPNEGLREGDAHRLLNLARETNRL